MRAVAGIGIIVLVGAFATFIRQNIDDDVAILMVGVVFGILAGIPTALMVGHRAPPSAEISLHHTHDVAVRFIPPSVQAAMGKYGADDAVKINGQWLLLDGDQVVLRQRLLSTNERC